MEPKESTFAKTLKQPVLLFMLWALNEGVCTNEKSFHACLGETFPTSTLINQLAIWGLLEHSEGHLSLTPEGHEVVQYFVKTLFTDAA